ncbi:hypothetical protein HDU85_002109 [Gaertneriomyces sp. JEL0708]|nr:hypothetical protein HDU85_002109 [Gaertneriomyces sp. JEL0708]
MDKYQYEQLIQDFQTKLSISIDPQADSNEFEPSSSNSEEPPRHITRLLIFDFDSTLFHSPLPSTELWSDTLAGALIGDCGWFSEPKTLQPPYIPDAPSEEWWDPEVVRAAREGIKDKQRTLTVLLTGRRHDLFGDRIIKMCQALNPPLKFDLLFFREGHNVDPQWRHPTTLDFKLGVLRSLLKHFPMIDHIELYDDRKRHLDLFAKELQVLCKKGKVKSFLVKHVVHAEVKHMPPELEKGLVEELVGRCNGRIAAAKRREEEEKHTGAVDLPCKPQRRTSASIFRSLLELTEQVRYTGIFFKEDDIQKLRDKFGKPSDTWSFRADHVTICMGPAKDNLVEPLGGVGAEVDVCVTAVGSIPDRVLAVKVEQPSEDAPPLSENATPHITIAVSIGAKAQESNHITEWTPLDAPFILTGTIKEKKVVGLQVERGPAQMKKKEVSIGNLIQKHHPHLKGRGIGMAVREVDEWMAKTFIENNGQNAAVIEWFVQGLRIDELLEKSASGSLDRLGTSRSSLPRITEQAFVMEPE